eukprot:CAMPEP_0115271706 /NCGR_PEP_ID=MMETSP0270-20121206/54242_1 /TAXON_ID=71861 /ORGANISM="Scrippsiella trochoidea, Strain CCMP3099" /LENGTH=254 /DNA_ID=CAMNT_0002688083 /DNA_START=195 /DNA_END=959 /DNA_ORIENTATION=-
MHDNLRRVTRHEAVDFKTTNVLMPSSWAHPKSRLMQALTDSGVTSEDLDMLLEELLLADHGKAYTCDVLSALEGTTWRLLAAYRPCSSLASIPEIAFYSGSKFVHQGTVQNGGLFKAFVKTQPVDAKLSDPEMRIVDGEVTVSVDIEAATGVTKTLTYTTTWIQTSATSFQRSLLSFELPEPIGARTPLLESSDMIEVAYFDEELLVLRDEKGRSEFLVHELVQPFGNAGSNEVFRSAVACAQGNGASAVAYFA